MIAFVQTWLQVPSRFVMLTEKLKVGGSKVRFDRVFDWDFVPFNEASDKFMNRLVPGLMPSKVEDQVHNWNATRPKGLGTGSDSEPLSVQRIGVVRDPNRLPFWCATWFTVLTNMLALSSLRCSPTIRMVSHSS